MGYRSDVSIAIYAPEPEMTAFIAAQRLKQAAWIKDRYHVNKYVTRCVDDNGSKYDKTIVLILAEFDCVKWYSHFDDVSCWVRCIGDAQGLNLNTEFVRIGDDYEDVETEYTGGDCSYHLGVTRSIEYNLPQFIEE